MDNTVIVVDLTNRQTLEAPVLAVWPSWQSCSCSTTLPWPVYLRLTIFQYLDSSQILSHWWPLIYCRLYFSWKNIALVRFQLPFLKDSTPFFPKVDDAVSSVSFQWQITVENRRSNRDTWRYMIIIKMITVWRWGHLRLILGTLLVN